MLMTGDEYLVLMENTSYEDFTKQIYAVHSRLDNISLGLTSMGYAWEKVGIEVEKLVTNAEVMMREEKKKYYKNLKKGHHEPIIKQDLLEDIRQPFPCRYRNKSDVLFHRFHRRRGHLSLRLF